MSIEEMRQAINEAKWGTLPGNPDFIHICTFPGEGVETAHYVQQSIQPWPANIQITVISQKTCDYILLYEQ